MRPHCLIARLHLMSDPVEGVFDSYGLSRTATIPWF
ncbi:type I-F CRISPR-associated endoribonuclease Cas6/Csy4 [Photobacterium phosphoreum]